MAAAFAADSGIPMLDLRRNSEFDDGYVAGAKHVPLHELRGRLDEVAAWAARRRARSGVDLLRQRVPRLGRRLDPRGRGRRRVHVDDDFPNAAKAGLAITTPEHGHRLGATYAD